jgi:hypothetical protein
VHRARCRALLLDVAVASADAVELVGGVEAEEVDGRLPFDDVRVDVDLVAGEREGLLAAARLAQRGLEALCPLRAAR